MKARRIIIPMVLLLSLALTITVFAETTYFYLIRGASSSSSSLATKYEDDSYLYFHPSSYNQGWERDDQYINFRGRNSAREYATYLETVNTPGDYYATYYGSEGFVGDDYYLYSNYPSDQPTSYAYVSVYWRP